MDSAPISVMQDILDKTILKNPFKYNNLTPLDIEKRQIGNVQISQDNTLNTSNKILGLDGEVIQLKKNISKLSQQNMLKKVKSKDSLQRKNVSRYIKEPRVDYKYKMLGGLGPNLGSERWKEKMNLYQKGKAVASKN